MLARLLLALLIALLPMPAAVAGGACHDAPPIVKADSHHGHAQQPHPADPSPGEQFCLGCAAPSTLRAPLIRAPFAQAGEVRTPRVHAGLIRVASPPATPPPRSDG